MARHRTHSIAFKRQVVQEYLAGETLHGLTRRHDLSRTLIRTCVGQYAARISARVDRTSARSARYRRPAKDSAGSPLTRLQEKIRYFTRA